MTVHEFFPQTYYTAFGSFEPALRIKSGDTVITTTVDNEGRDANDKHVILGGNPLTGPFYVENAEPGDCLAVRLDNLWPNRNLGRASTVIAANVLDPDYIFHRSPDWPIVTSEWKLNLKEGTATLISPETKLGHLVLALDPMLGCLGVSPPRGQIIAAVTSGKYGGNMDYRGFVSGVTAYFPVFTLGGLFFVGDGHAVQGEGEIVGTGIEVSFDVQFTVELQKRRKIGWPRAEDEKYILTVGNARPLDQALQNATTEMIQWLQEDFNLDERAAHILMGQCVEYNIGNVFDPAYTIVCKLRKDRIRTK